MASTVPGTTGAKLKGFYFNRGREQIWSNLTELIEKNTSWKFDFEEYGNCLRFDLPPFKLPYQFTVCYKINHDFNDYFNITNFMSTKSGKSSIDELEKYP